MNASDSLSRMVRRLVITGFAAAVWFVPDHARAQIPPEPQVRSASPSMATDQERAILLEFFRATGGTRWKQALGWNTASDPCEWQGIICLPVQEDGRQRWAPAELNLIDNGLTGAVPLSLLQLRHLKRLSLAGNQITAVPPEVFTRADENRLDVWLTGNPIPELLARVTLRIDNVTGFCMPGHQLQFAGEFDGVTRRARYQAMFCPGQSEEDSYCLSAEPRFGSNLDLVSRGLRRLGWTRQTQRHGSPMGSSDHEERFKAVLVWGDGTSQEISISGGQAPIDIQIGQQLLRALVWPAWTATAKRVKCDIPRL